MRSNAVGRRRRNQNQLTEVYHHEICLRADLLSRRLLSEVFSAEHQSKTKGEVNKISSQGACTNSRNPAITTYKSGDCFKSKTWRASKRLIEQLASNSTVVTSQKTPKGLRIQNSPGRNVGKPETERACDSVHGHSTECGLSAIDVTDERERLYASDFAFRAPSMLHTELRLRCFFLRVCQQSADVLTY